MKYDCELIQDIMPLYIDDVLSDKSRKIVGEHLSECSDCRELYKKCSADKNPPVAEDHEESSVRIEKYSKKIRKRRIAIASIIFVFILTVTASFVSYVKFDTPDFLRSGIGLARIMLTDTPYVEIQSNPRVILAQSENSAQLFSDSVEAQGYHFVADEQYGSMYTVEKEDKKEQIHFSANRYFSKWSWQ